jgi:hypothetical protein
MKTPARDHVIHSEFLGIRFPTSDARAASRTYEDTPCPHPDVSWRTLRSPLRSHDRKLNSYEGFCLGKAEYGREGGVPSVKRGTGLLIYAVSTSRDSISIATRCFFAESSTWLHWPMSRFLRPIEGSPESRRDLKAEYSQGC